MGFLPLAAEMVRCGVGTDTQEEWNVHGFAASVSDPSWGRGGMEGTLAQSGLVRMRPSRRGHAPGLFRLWDVFLGARGRDPIGSELRVKVSHPIASGLFSPLPHG